MEKYDFNKAHNNMTVKLISIKLQIDEYVGYLKVKMGGNTSPLEVMNQILDDISDGDIEIDEKLNPQFEVLTGAGAGGDHVWFHTVLYRPDGARCTVEDELEMLEYHVTGIELVGLEVDE